MPHVHYGYVNLLWHPGWYQDNWNMEQMAKRCYELSLSGFFTYLLWGSSMSFGWASQSLVLNPLFSQLFWVSCILIGEPVSVLTWSHLVLDFYAGLKLWEPYTHTVLSNQQKAHPDFFLLYINLKGGKTPEYFGILHYWVQINEARFNSIYI